MNRKSVISYYFRFLVPLLVSIVTVSVNGKIYDRCELAQHLRYQYNIGLEHVAVWVCIAHYQSGYNTSAYGYQANGVGYYGMYQISDQYWCSPPGSGQVCATSCYNFLDDSINDDFDCMKKIYEEHQRISGNGFNAWSVYPSYCSGDGSLVFLQGCFDFHIEPQNIYQRSVTSYNHDNQINSIQNYDQPRVGRIYERCELAHELHYRHNIPKEQLATWVCIAQHESNFNTSAIGRLNADGSGDHGLFQISDIYWCSPPGKGWACGLTCSQLEDADITDDVQCMRKIHAEHQRISGDGFNAWTVYPLHCRGRSESYISGCFPNDSQNTIDNQVLPRPAVTAPPPPQQRISNENALAKYTGKVYERCELANELKYKHNIPLEQIATWICIAQHESNFNTSAIGRLNADGSEDHGLFQISDIYWCSPPGKGWACGLSCSQLEDNDITDDVQCMRKIHAEHQQISGDGFNAWTVYPLHCRGRSESYISGCFPNDSHNTIDYQVLPRPAITAPPPPSQLSPQPRFTGKVYDRCELAHELHSRHSIPQNQISTWICIAQHESNFNTSAIGRLNADGSEDHGLFQISDIYWCSPPGKGWACGLSCSQLEDNDITDDVECMKKIYEEHQRISGDGFNAWTVYPSYCKGRSEQYLTGCNLPIHNDIYKKYDPPTYTTKSNKPKKTGKIYNRCDLANELLHTFNFPDYQIATWVCIVQHESNFNTSAIGRLNYDGSEDHGLFQISDIYWCSPPNKGWACGLSCSDLEDNDITDDVECIRKIHAEHQRLSGDGFNAWSVYARHCKGNVQKYISGCDMRPNANNYNIVRPQPAITAPPPTSNFIQNSYFKTQKPLLSTQSSYTKSSFYETKSKTKDKFSTQQQNPFSSNFFLNRAFQNVKPITQAPQTTQANNQNNYFDTKYSANDPFKINSKYNQNTNAPSNNYNQYQYQTQNAHPNYGNGGAPVTDNNVNTNSITAFNYEKSSQPYAYDTFSQITTTQPPQIYYQQASSKVEVMTKPQSTTFAPRQFTTIRSSSTTKQNNSPIRSQYNTSFQTEKNFITKTSTSTSQYNQNKNIFKYREFESTTLKTTTSFLSSSSKHSSSKSSSSTSVLSRPFITKPTTPTKSTTFNYTNNKSKNNLSKPTLASNKSSSLAFSLPIKRNTTPKSIATTSSFRFNKPTTQKSKSNTKLTTTTTVQYQNTKITTKIPQLTSSRYISSTIATITSPSKSIITASTASTTKSEAALKFDLWFDQFKH